MKVYLAGPIFGRTDEECRAWREEAKRLLAPHETLDPMQRDFRGYEEQNAARIVRHDLAEIRQADLLLVNAKQASWGTAMELVYAHRAGKNSVAFCSGRVSPWLRYHTTAVFPTLLDAVESFNARRAL
jgi:nucleoside 2-deoxyribosyltransferase